ncbi:hypothetical protein OAJ82_02870 [Alphaproteobacteria bacterium]|nr:hypothetical protein [Alphaproteobacteria bacterium]
MLFDTINNLLFSYQIWLIIGIIFLLLELADGSLILCLPLGVGGFIISIFVFIFNDLLINEWYVLVLIWAIGSSIISYFLSRFWKKGLKNKDINDY